MSLLGVFLASCAKPYYPGDDPSYSPTRHVYREEAVAIAGSYVDHRWIPSPGNVLHGVDVDGVRVDTPNKGFGSGRGREFGWEVGEVYTGVPYKWGGFDTPDSFDKKVEANQPAGDMYTSNKRRLLDNAVSSEAAGIDCSGFISRCWRLSRSYSTRELPSLCEPLVNFSELQKGDLVSKFNDHAILFAGWTDSSRTKFFAYEAGAPPFRKTQTVTYRISFLTKERFQPYRYKGIRD